MKKILLVITLLSLSACITIPPSTKVTVVASTPPVVAPKADPLVLAPVEWKVYNSAMLKELSDKLVASGGNMVLFTLDETNFKNLTGNLNSINGFVDQQNATIDFLNKAANAPANAPKTTTATPTEKK